MSISYNLLHNIHVQVVLWTWEDIPLDTRFLNMLKCTDTGMPNHRAGGGGWKTTQQAPSLTVDHFYVVLFSAFKQTHYTCMWLYMSD